MKAIWRESLNQNDLIWVVIAGDKSQRYETHSLEDAFKAYKTAPLWQSPEFDDVIIDVTQKYNTDGYWEAYQLINNKYVCDSPSNVAYSHLRYAYNNKNYTLYTLLKTIGVEGIVLTETPDNLLTPVPYRLSMTDKELRYDLLKIKVQIYVPKQYETHTSLIYPIAHVILEELNQSITHTRHKLFQVHEDGTYMSIGNTPNESFRLFKDKLLESIEYTNSLS